MRSKFFILIYVLLCFCKTLLIHAQERPNIIYKPITWNAERERLSLEYLLKRHGISQDSARITPRIIVVHFTENMSVNATFKTFNPVLLPGRKDLQGASQLNVSSQFIVSRTGQIYQIHPDNYFARHTIGLNYCAIGIENIGTSKNPLTKAQLKANAALISYLQTKYKIDYVVGHHEYELFNKTLWWRETNPTYITKKRDPGNQFITALRVLLGFPQKLEITNLP